MSRAIPERRIARRALASLAGSAALIWFACTGSGADSAATPEPTPTPIAGGLPVPMSLIPALDAIEAAVAESRGYAAEGEYTRELLPRAALREFLSAELTTEESVELIAFEERLFKLLGLIEQDADLTAEYEELYGSQIAGLYNDESNQLFVVEDSGGGVEELSVMEEVTYAHEYFHLLQDDRFDLTAMLEAAEGSFDRSLALTAFVEGEATLAQTEYMTEEISPLRLLGALSDLGELLGAQPDAPYVLQRSLEFPYTAGMEFAAAVAGGPGGQTELAYGSPPVSTEQIIHPQKYLAGEGPVEVDIPNVADVLGKEWAEIESDVLGEFFLRTWLEALNTPPLPDAAAAGWGGDNVVLLAGPGGESALAIVIEWDGGFDDAEEFANALALGLARSREFTRLTGEETPAVWDGPGGALALATDGDGRTLIAVAPGADGTMELMDAVSR